ncbi:MAG: hypothetical protein IIB61_02630 [Planctomycetes bacterium]|nr:hypothetical protein [Planctomycetota bacterium]
MDHIAPDKEAQVTTSVGYILQGLMQDGEIARISADPSGPFRMDLSRFMQVGVAAVVGGRIMGSLAGLGGLAGHGGIAGKGGGLAA